MDELTIILKGSLLMTLEDQEYMMEEGDAIYIRSHTPHRYRKISDGECVMYSVRCTHP